MSNRDAVDACFSQFLLDAFTRQFVVGQIDNESLLQFVIWIRLDQLAILPSWLGRRDYCEDSGGAFWSEGDIFDQWHDRLTIVAQNRFTIEVVAFDQLLKITVGDPRMPTAMKGKDGKNQHTGQEQ